MILAVILSICLCVSMVYRVVARPVTCGLGGSDSTLLDSARSFGKVLSPELLVTFFVTSWGASAGERSLWEENRKENES